MFWLLAMRRSARAPVDWTPAEAQSLLLLPSVTAPDSATQPMLVSVPVPLAVVASASSGASAPIARPPPSVQVNTGLAKEQVQPFALNEAGPV